MAPTEIELRIENGNGKVCERGETLNDEDLNRQVNSIGSRQDLAEFIKALISDYENNPGGWENKNLSAYLDGLAGWTKDMDGYFRNIGAELPEQPSWKLLGEMLLAAKYYE